MTNVLSINTGLNGKTGKSNQLVSTFVKQLSNSETTRIVERDLAREDLPHLKEIEMQAWATPKQERNKQQALLALLSDKLIAELQNADVIVLGMPMYNFGTPSVFKAWIDRVARTGVTFSYTENGPIGLLKNKKVYVLATRGGLYAGTPKDTQSQYIKDVFSFMGMDDIEFIYAEGLAMGDDAASRAWSDAEQKMIDIISARAA